MPMTNAERQRKYRQSRPAAKENGQRHLFMWVDTEVLLALKRLATHYAVTDLDVLSRLVLEVDKATTPSFNDEAAWQAYIEAPLRRNRLRSSKRS